jgi:hypothetical protein
VLPGQGHHLQPGHRRGLPRRPGRAADHRQHLPSRPAVGRFQDIQAGQLRGLLPQTLRLGDAEGLVDLSLVAGDGAKATANAAMGANADEAGLQAQIEDLQAQLAVAHEAWAAQAAASGQPGALFDGPAVPRSAGDGRGKAWRRLGTLNRMLASRRAALAWLREHPDADTVEWQDRLERDQARAERRRRRVEAARAEVQAANDRRQAARAAGTKAPGAKPVPVEEHAKVRRARQALENAEARARATAASRPASTKVNATDPASRVMKAKNGGYGQLHNILDAAGITGKILLALFDNGYASKANFAADLPVGTLLVAITKEDRQTGRRKPPAAETTTGADTVPGAGEAVPEGWQEMAALLEDPGNAKLYKQRAAIIEPLFAQLLARFGRALNFRGDEDVDTELHLWAAAHNMLKILRSRRRKSRRPG